MEKMDEMLNFKNWVLRGPFNQITLIFIQSLELRPLNLLDDSCSSFSPRAQSIDL